MTTSDSDSEGSKRLALQAERGELHHTGDRVYLGSLDDSVSRHPWENLVPSIGHLNRTLIDNALFGAPLCVRVGNLLYQPEYLPALLDSRVSPLIDLARVGFIQIQTIKEGINNSIDARLKEGTRSAQEFAAKYDWRPGSVIHDNLRLLDSKLLGGPGIAQYNADFRRTFRRVMRESVSSESVAFSRVAEVWLRRPKQGDGYQSRDNFEKDAMDIFGADTAAITEAMWVANAANHYAYALHLYNASAGTRPMVETRQFDRHAEVCAIRDTVSAEQADEILGKRNSVNSALQIIQIPEEVYHPQFWPKLAKIARPGEDHSADSRDRLLRRNFLRAKYELASRIDFFLDNPEKFEERDIFAASKEYSIRLHEALGTSGESRLKLHLHLTLQQARVSGTSAALSGGASAAIGASLDLMATGVPGLGALAGFTIGFMLEVLGLNVGDILLRVSRHRIANDGIVDVDNEGSPATSLAKHANHNAGSYVGTRSISPAKAAQLLGNQNSDD